AVALVVIVGLGDALRPVFAVVVRSLQYPRAVGLVAPVEQMDASPELRAGIGLAADRELQPRGAAFETGMTDFACHGVPGSVPMVCGNANKSIWHRIGTIRD